MSVAELQKKLIDKISKTNDASLLEDIYNFIGADEEVAGFYKLTDAQLSVVEESQQQIENGNCFTDDGINKEIDEWLGK
jgi:hypothetical protein